MNYLGGASGQLQNSGETGNITVLPRGSNLNDEAFVNTGYEDTYSFLNTNQNGSIQDYREFSNPSNHKVKINFPAGINPYVLQI